jgi:NADP-dependent aldehyde dehydrogenase
MTATRGLAAASAAWAATSREDRAAALAAVADALDAATDDLVPVADQETALGEARLQSEVARTSGQLRMFAERARNGRYLEAVIS